jgi:hypothetical protein
VPLFLLALNVSNKQLGQLGAPLHIPFQCDPFYGLN